jgi:acyl-CoA thioesterase-1
VNEPNPLLRWAMFHFAGGDAYVCGLLAFSVCQFALLSDRSPAVRRWLIIASWLGLVWAAADPPPVPWILLAPLGALLLAGIWQRPNEAKNTSPDFVRRGRLYRIGLASLAAAGIAWELPNLFTSPPDLTVKTLGVVGDSITAGLNDGEDTWPKQLSRQIAVDVVDASQPGATLKSARKQVELLNPHPCDLLLLEIGGNDLLEGLPLPDFERDLDQLLAMCQRPGRSVVMLELPLPPWAMRYGAIQRQLASKYHVSLVPRRRFLGVLTAAGATVDGIHLSNTGQARLTGLVQSLLTIGSASPSEGTYQHVEDGRLASKQYFRAGSFSSPCSSLFFLGASGQPV